MADNRTSYQSQITNIQGNRGRVYINPNFNKNPSSYRACSTNMYMHVNRGFQHCMLNPPQQTQSASNAKKIYVNPNFFRPELKTTIKNRMETTTSNVLTYSYSNVLPPVKETKTNRPTILVNSRYCLVQNNEKKMSENTCLNKPRNTIKISKYKSVAINNIMKNISDIKNKVIVPAHNVTKMRQKPLTTLNMYSKLAKRVINMDKTKINVVFKKNKSEKYRLKKNNMPCPLFKKFGKCIRDEKGFCEFLHDKKHVNICRSFLKGICHDKGCLLSHELSVKKMPTCYFYLKGVCAKENCPYLHVKVNKNSRVCPDFLKGYCEKGQHCSYQHINSNQTSRKYKNRSLKKQKCSQIITGEQIKLKHPKPSFENKNPNHVNNYEAVEYRYYKEQKHEISIEIETIKPSRCKLGVLPTFIQL